MRRNKPIWGHSLIVIDGVRIGECQCGMVTPVPLSMHRRRLWHNDHKDDIRAGGTGKVWEGGKP